MTNALVAFLLVTATMAVEQAQEKAGQPPSLRNADIVKLVALGVSEDTVIAVIRETTNRAFDTSDAGIATLRSSGVSPRIVAAIQGRAVPARPPAPDERIDRAKFDGVYRAAMAVEGAVATNILVRQLEPLLQTFKTEAAAALERASTRAERDLASKYDAARTKFELGVAQRDLSRYDSWKAASTMLDEANRAYLGR